MLLLLKAATLFLAPLIIYSQDLLVVANDAVKTELGSYMLVIPFFISYALYRKRSVLRAVVSLNNRIEQIHFDETLGVVLCSIALILYVYGSYSFYVLELHLLSFPIFVAGVILILFNRETLRALIFPLALLSMLTVPPAEIAFLAGTELSNVGSEISFNILKSLGLPVDLTVPEGSPVLVLSSSSGVASQFAIAVACSGIYSLLGFAVFALFASYVVKGVAWKKAVIFLSGFLLIFALNVMRVTLIVLIGYGFGEAIAMKIFHIFGGWALVFAGTILLLFLGERILKIKIPSLRTDSEYCGRCLKNLEENQGFCLSCGRLTKFPRVRMSKREVLKVSAIILSALIILSIGVPIFATTEGLPRLALQTPQGLETSQILPRITGYNATFMYRDIQFEQRYGQERSLIYWYTSNGSYPLIWVAIELAGVRSPLHNWDMCYFIHEQRGEFVRLDLRDFLLLQYSSIVARFYSFQVVKKGNHVVEGDFKETILYWFTRAAFDTGKGIEWKFVKISVWADTWNLDFRHTEEKLLVFGRAIAEYWRPAQSWSLAAVITRGYGNTLLAAAASSLVLLTGFAISGDWKSKRLNGKIYGRLVGDDKRALRAVGDAATSGKPTLDAIARAYEKRLNRPTQDSELLEKLNRAEKVGLLRQTVANDNEQPFLVWKINFRMKE